VSMTPEASNELNKAIRSQGLVGVTLLLVTMVMFVYRTGTADGKRHGSVAETARVALETGQSDLQGLFNERGPERNIALLKKYTTFGWDFVPAWMIFILFLQRIIVNYGPSARRYLWTALGVVVLTIFANVALNGFIATAERQAITDAELNRIVFFGQLKWSLLFLDALIAALQLYLTPPILLVGAIILGTSSLAAFFSEGVPSGLFVSYGVLGIFFAFAGISILLLFEPQLLYEKWNLPSGDTKETTPTSK
jgi:hypothetical protein